MGQEKPSKPEADDCVFCEIVNEDSGERIIYETDSVVCFHDIALKSS